MYLSYDKLWKLLSDKRLSKTDLCALTGISSRTMAKLTKNQSVTTDTLLQICRALRCDISAIVEIHEETDVDSIYEAYLRYGKTTAETELTKVVEFSYQDISFAIHVLKQKATKRTVIHCHPGGSVVAEQLYPLGISPTSELQSVFQPFSIEKGKVTVLLIPGAPGTITGLDNGIVRSARRGCETEGFYVMSLSAFKLFDFNI